MAAIDQESPQGQPSPSPAAPAAAEPAAPASPPAAAQAPQAGQVSPAPGGAAERPKARAGGDAQNRANLRDKAKAEPYSAAAQRVAPAAAGAGYAKSKDAAEPPRPGPASAPRPQALPHVGRIQAAFGKHDISSVKAFRGDAAAEEAKAAGAAAYTAGDTVVFGAGAEDLFTAAHEAAHVVQQRRGVSLGGGEGQAGDVYEKHADAVAERVVAGQSAEDLLDQVPGGSQKAAPGKPAGVQKRVWVGSNKETKATFVMPGSGLGEQDRTALQSGGVLSASRGAAEIWPEVWKAVCELVTVNPELAREGIEAEVKAKFDSWVGERSAIENAGYAKPEGPLQSPERAAAQAPAPAAPGQSAAPAATPAPAPLAVAHTEQRVYPEIRLLATALIHESHPQYLERVAVETELAIKVAADPQYAGAVRSVAAKLAATLSAEDVTALERLAATSRYAAFSSLPKAREILAGGGDVGEVIILLDEYNNYWKNKGPEFDKCKQDMRANLGDFRVNGWTVQEDNPWVMEARKLGVPLMAGPSGTTNGIMALGQSLGADGASLYKVAWAMHAFFNGMWRGQSGTHRLHEVMAAAQPYCGSAFTYHPSLKELG